MKIFLSFLQSDKHYAIPAYSFWQYYIKNGITEAGHTWTEHPHVNWALGLVPQSKADHLRWKENAWSKTLAWLKKHRADLFLSYLYPEQIDINAVSEIQKMGIPCVNFFCDNVRNFNKAPAEFSVFDLNWVPEFKAIKMYQNAGHNYINLPMPMWVDPKFRIFPDESSRKITFIGSKDIQRLRFFESIVSLSPQIPLTIYGSGWDESLSSGTVLPQDYTLIKKLIHQSTFIKNNGVIPYLRKLGQHNISNSASPALKAKIGGLICFEDYNKLTAQSMITIGVNRYPSLNFPVSRPDTYSRLRDIEAPMLGACYLTEQTEAIENLYDIGNEIELYNNEEIFVEKVKELQADKNKRGKLKINGQKRALLDHSIPQSLNKIFKRLNR
ncbi:MAG: hypothetical protein JWQ66_4426 [Mucilaginibacter sp.]|nr:hypothetical protein [Mucilaginibacter sp.]